MSEKVLTPLRENYYFNIYLLKKTVRVLIIKLVQGIMYIF